MIKSPGAGGALSLNGAPGTDPSIIGAAPQWVKVASALSHTAFQTAAATNTITLFTLAIAGVIHATKIKQSASFTGGAIATYTLSIGIGGNLTKYGSAFDVFQAPSNTAFQVSAVTGSENHGATTPIVITATSTGANLSASTAGAVDVWVLLSRAP